LMYVDVYLYSTLLIFVCW